MEAKTVYFEKQGKENTDAVRSSIPILSAMSSPAP